MTRTSARAEPGGSALGIDIGATKVLVGRVDPRGRVLSAQGPERLADRRPSEVLRQVVSLVNRLEHDDRSEPVGVAIAAQVDPERGVVLHAPNLGWRSVPFGRSLERALGRSVRLENDVRSVTWGEWRHGRHRGTPDLACLYVGTGVGGGFVVDGHLLYGATGAAGEIGHLTVVAGGRACSCGHRGCLEAYVGGWAIARRARERIRSSPAKGRSLLARAGSVRAVDARSVFDAAREGDGLAIEIVRETEETLGAGLVGIVNAFNPARVLLGGGIIESWAGVTGRLESVVRRRAQPPAARAVRVGRVTLGPEAPVVGAASLARDVSASPAHLPGLGPSGALGPRLRNVPT